MGGKNLYFLRKADSRNLKSVGMSELLMEDDEICLSVLERQRRSQSITFEQVTEAPETGCVTGNRNLEYIRERINGQGKKHKCDRGFGWQEKL